MSSKKKGRKNDDILVLNRTINMVQSKQNPGARPSSEVPGPSETLPGRKMPNRGSFRQARHHGLDKSVNCEMCNCATMETYLKKHIQYNHMVHKKNIVDILYSIHYPSQDPKQQAQVWWTTGRAAWFQNIDSRF